MMTKIVLVISGALINLFSYGMQVAVADNLVEAAQKDNSKSVIAVIGTPYYFSPEADKSVFLSEHDGKLSVTGILDSEALFSFSKVVDEEHNTRLSFTALSTNRNLVKTKPYCFIRLII